MRLAPREVGVGRPPADALRRGGGALSRACWSAPVGGPPTRIQPDVIRDAGNGWPCGWATIEPSRARRASGSTFRSRDEGSTCRLQLAVLRSWAPSLGCRSRPVTPRRDRRLQRRLRPRPPRHPRRSLPARRVRPRSRNGHPQRHHARRLPDPELHPSPARNHGSRPGLP
jgi:hypothetical protein